MDDKYDIEYTLAIEELEASDNKNSMCFPSTGDGEVISIYPF